jgi:hypothetical protein
MDIDTAARLHEMQLQELLNDPKKFGAPTFEEFCKNHDKFATPYNSFGSIANGSKMFGELVQKHEYEIMGYRVKSLEQVEKVARDHGLKLHEMGWTAELVPQGGGWANHVFKFMPKAEKERRETW